MANCDYDLAKQRQSLAGTLHVVFVYFCMLYTMYTLRASAWVNSWCKLICWFNSWVFKRSQLAMNAPGSTRVILGQHGSSWVNTGFCQDVAYVALVMVVLWLPARCSVRLGLAADGLSSGRCLEIGGSRDDMWWYVMICDDMWWYVILPLGSAWFWV